MTLTVRRALEHNVCLEGVQPKRPAPSCGLVHPLGRKTCDVTTPTSGVLSIYGFVHLGGSEEF
jgi:hypothetical protein